MIEKILEIVAQRLNALATKIFKVDIGHIGKAIIVARRMQES